MPAYENITSEPRQERVKRARKRQIIFERNLFPEPLQAPVGLKDGDMVLVKNFIKRNFGPTWVGSYAIVNREGESVYTGVRGVRAHEIHVDDLRPAPLEGFERNEPQSGQISPEFYIRVDFHHENEIK